MLATPNFKSLVQTSILNSVSCVHLPFSIFPLQKSKSTLNLLCTKMNSLSSILHYLNLPFPSVLMSIPSFCCSDHKLWGHALSHLFLLHSISNLSWCPLGFSYKIYLESDHLAIPPLIFLWSEASSHLGYYNNRSLCFSPCLPTSSIFINQ